MRMSTDEDRDEERALETIAAAAAAGITVFDTARSYGHDEAELGHNERLVAAGAPPLRAPTRRARIVTKGGMTRAGGRWITDGRARSDSRRLRGEPRRARRPADRPLPHPCAGSANAVANLGARAGATRRRGPRAARRRRERQPPPAGRGARARADRGGSGRAQPVRRRALCGRSRRRAAPSAGSPLIAHSPLGGPRRAGRLARNDALADVAQARGATPAEVALAWLLDLSPVVVAIPGARRPGDRALGRARCRARPATPTIERRWPARSAGFAPLPSRAARPATTARWWS